METILVILAFVLMVTGLLGAVVPVIPGPPLTYAGLLLLRLGGSADFSTAFLLIWAAITAAVVVADNFLPAWMTKKFGGSRAAVAGSFLGMIAGMFFFPPAGLVLGPFLGAFAGEILHSRISAARGTELPETRGGSAKALKVAAGAFLAFIVGTGAKLIVSAVMIFYAVKAVLAIF